MGVITDNNRVPVYDLPPYLRPVLNFDSNPTLPVRKAGVVPFLRQNNQIFVLLQCKRANGLFESFAGSVDYDDDSLEETAAREAHEESNGVLDYAMVRKEISQDFCVYHARGKCCLFFLEISAINPASFGDREIHDDIPRSCHWVSLETVRLYNLHPQLRYSEWDSTLKKLLES